MRWLRYLALLWLFGTLIVPATAQEEADPTVNWSVTPVYGELSKQGVWLPIRVNIENTGVDRVFTVLANDRYALEVDVPGGGNKEVIFHVFQNMSSRLRVQLLVDQTVIGSQRLDIRNTTASIVLQLASRPTPALPTVRFTQLNPQALPATLMGLDLLDALVVDFEAWQQLGPAQQTTIEEWVAHGGTLIAVPDVLASLPESLQPAQLGAPRTFRLAEIAADQQIPATEPLLDGVQLLPQADTVTLLSVPTGPVLVARYHGAGRVVAPALALDDPALLRWNLTEQLWTRSLPGQSTAPVWQGVSNPHVLRDSMVGGFLTNLPALDLPPLRMLLILLAVYVVLVGPVNYLVLRRLDRMALAWATIPALTLLFAGLAYGFGAQQRGSDIILNELLVIEQHHADQPATLAQGYVGVFSPHQTTYTLHGSPNIMFREVIGGVSSPGGKHMFMSSPAQVRNLSINQWSMENVAFVQQLETSPQVQLDLLFEGDRLHGSVRNTGTVPLSDTAIVMGNQAQKLGYLAPGAQQPIDLQVRNKDQQNALSYVLYQQELDKGYRTPQGPPRELLARTQALDTVAVGSEYQPGQPLFVAFPQFDNLTTVTLPDQRYAQQRITVLLARPRLRFGSGTFSLPPTMITLASVGKQGANGGDWCMTGRGAGLSLTTDTTTMQLRLPETALASQLESLAFAPFVDGMFTLADMTLSIYNWQTASWEPQTLERNRFTLEDPAYVKDGLIQLRIEPLNQPAGRRDEWWGCFSPGLTYTGSTP